VKDSFDYKYVSQKLNLLLTKKELFESPFVNIDFLFGYILFPQFTFMDPVREINN